VTPALVLGVLFHDIAKPLTRSVDPDGRIRFSGHEKLGAEITETILTRLRFPRADIDATVSAVANHMSFKDVRNMRPSTLRRFMARPGFEDELELHRVDCSGSHGMLDNHRFLTEQLATFAHEPLIPKPLLTGRDLIEAGLSPSPTFKGILDAALSLQMENRLTTREQALAWLKSQPTPANPSPNPAP
jgi:poly(A) polymerase